MNSNQEAFASTLSQLSGLNLQVVRAWVASEGNSGARGQPANNDLFIGGASGPSMGSTPQEGAVATWNWLQKQSNFKGIIASAQGSPQQQLQAIWQSPWDAGHYGGNGQNLVRTYNSLTGSQSASSGTTASSSSGGATLLSSSGPTPIGQIGPWSIGPWQLGPFEPLKGGIDVALFIMALVLLAIGVVKILPNSVKEGTKEGVKKGAQIAATA